MHCSSLILVLKVFPTDLDADSPKYQWFKPTTCGSIPQARWRHSAEIIKHESGIMLAITKQTYLNSIYVQWLYISVIISLF